MPRRPAIAVFSRIPVPGRAKTRLIPLLGAQGAAELHRALYSDTIAKVRRLSAKITKYVFITPRKSSSRMAPRPFKLRFQRGRDLGARLENAFEELFPAHAPLLIVGADSPLIPVSRFALALEELKTCDAVLGPCADGGYYLIGFRRSAPGVLRGVRWGGRFAFRDTLRNILSAGLTCSVLEEGTDVDTPHDFIRLKNELQRDPAARRGAPETWKFVKK